MEKVEKMVQPVKMAVAAYWAKCGNCGNDLWSPTGSYMVPADELTHERPPDGRGEAPRNQTAIRPGITLATTSKVRRELMKKCAICKEHEAAWAYQPFGPGEAASFAFLGSHYRGFAVVPICNDCKRHIEEGFEEHFTYKSQEYQINGRRLPLQSRVRFVKGEADGLVHLLIGEEHELSLGMCGQTVYGEKPWPVQSPTVQELCADCMRGYADARQWDETDKEQHKPYPVYGRSTA